MAALTSADLKLMPLFSTLTAEQLEQLLDRHRETTHQAEQLIVMEQDWGESLFLLRSGLAKVRTYTADGEEVVMSLLGAGDVFGEMAALDGAARSADVVAISRPGRRGVGRRSRGAELGRHRRQGRAVSGLY